MKTAYELAMEKLQDEAPVPKLTDEQKAEIAELDNLYQSKLAEREVFLGGKIAEAQATAEGAPFDEEGLLRLLRLARIGCDRIFAAQADAVRA